MSRFFKRDKIFDILVSRSFNLRNCLERLSVTAQQILFVVDDSEKLIGAITDGDIRRALLEVVL